VERAAKRAADELEKQQQILKAKALEE